MSRRCTSYILNFKVAISYICIQDPKEADPFLRVQNDLDDTKIVLVSRVWTTGGGITFINKGIFSLIFSQHETIEQLLERGEKLDDLVQKTDKLSGTSKAFYKEVKN